MKKFILIGVITLLFGWAVYDFMSSSNDQDKIVASPPAQEGEVSDVDEVGLDSGNLAPDFELNTLAGETVRLSDYRGQRVIVNFWATWCPPCRAEIPDFQKVYDQEDVVILAVNLTESETSENKVTEFVDDFEMTFPVLMDEKSNVSTRYRVQAYPTSYMIDSNGRIQFLAMGAMNYDQMVQQLERMN